MSRTIESVDLGFSVYGRPQVAYTIAGQTGTVDFTAVVTAASLQQVTAFESEVAAYAAVVNKRKAKLEEIGQALAILQKDVGRFKSDAGSTDTVQDDNLATVKTIFDRYGLSLDGYDASKKTITRKGATMAVQTAESEVDIENAELDEVSTVMQSVINKRNNAYSTATTLLRKTSNTAKTLINGISI